MPRTFPSAILDLFPTRTHLVEVDYRDSLDDNMKEIQKCIDENQWYPLDEKLDEWFLECQDYSLDYYKKEMVDSLTSVFDVTKERAEQFVDKHRELIEEILCERDCSTPLDDLLRHTDNIVAFYDTGECFDETWCMPWNEQSKEQTRLCKILGVKKKDYQKQLDELFANASSGGRLVVFFILEPKQFIGINPEPTKIQFTNPHIALINTCNGSGFDVQLNCATVVLPFDRANLFIDETIKYNYTYAVCGMSSNWCDDTGVRLIHKPGRKKIQRSGLKATINIDNELTEKFRKTGQCTAGDMDMNRHNKNHMRYTNDIPCGTRCLKCGTFWID